MHTGLKIVLWLILAILFPAGAAFFQEDRKGCKDHLVFSALSPD